MQRLAGKVAIVTGASRGIGEACAKRIAREGAKVAVADIDGEAAQRVADAIIAAGGIAFGQPLNLTSDVAIAALFERVAETYGGLDILHNNAADTRPEQLGLDQKVGDLDPDVWDLAFQVNARGTMMMCRHAINAIVDVTGRVDGNGMGGVGGVIINTSSGASLVGDIYNPSYAASKAAVNSLTRYIATQYGKQGIRCNAVLPGLIMTAMAEHSLSSAQRRVIERQTLTPCLGTPEDIAGVVAFLASDDARYVNGQMISVDGGVLIHMPHAADMADVLAGRSSG